MASGQREADVGPEPGRGQALARRFGLSRLHAAERVSDLNDGIIGTAGIVEGFAGAGLGGMAVVLAAVSALIAGSIAVGGTKYAEVAAEREVKAALLTELDRVLQLSPQEELAELAELYEAKGLSAGLAEQVAEELSAHDALSAHAEAEYGISSYSPRPSVAAVGAGLAFMLGAALPLGIVWVTPLSLDGLITYAAVLVSLSISAVVLTRIGGSSLWHNVRRSVAIGVLTMTTAWLAGQLFT
ncbi:MAG: VIT1/CCC1 transporter family protein [Intrasporangium sp.]|uniref:VIT1/CCC1 transporter family protein n=1 Tax=Intrasporangium sp. TaxID=1925024 RepID=UPI002649B336|nr:VIT1/CCC1 transporter family protein [Intrasporangium sp.]MDN5794492.1 VIT1/CCC1 transporter family protein [Intrasporangium sp.]